MYLQFDVIRPNMFPDRATITRYLPKCFKSRRLYKNIRTIIDSTEIFVHNPTNFAKHGNLYSSYKNHITFKMLIGIAPSGTIVHGSDVFEGAISHNEVVVKSIFFITSTSRIPRYG